MVFQGEIGIILLIFLKLFEALPRRNCQLPSILGFILFFSGCPFCPSVFSLGAPVDSLSDSRALPKLVFTFCRWAEE